MRDIAPDDASIADLENSIKLWLAEEVINAMNRLTELKAKDSLSEVEASIAQALREVEIIINNKSLPAPSKRDLLMRVGKVYSELTGKRNKFARRRTRQAQVLFSDKQLDKIY